MKCLVNRQYSETGCQGLFHKNEKCFTILRLLLVIAIFSALFSVLIPKLNTFYSQGQMVAANKEVANVETAAKAYWIDNNGQWPQNDCNTDLIPNYLNKEAVNYNYEFDADGMVIVPDGKVSELSANIEWNEDKHLWERNNHKR